MKDKKEIAIQFGRSLDNDDFNLTKKLLSQECKYFIGEEILIGPDDICHSYEQNMIEGRNKLDALDWGQSSIEAINDSEYYVHFIDYLTHKGKSYTHKCKQLLLINDEGLVDSIKHIDNKEEQRKLDNYYREVGLME